MKRLISRARFPFVLQKDAMGCGVACLAMICRHFGRAYSLGTLERYCHPTNEGVSMLGISHAASDVGLETLTARIALDDIDRDALPCILHWRQDHFVVLHDISPSRGRFFVADPAKGKTSYTREEMEKGFLSTCSGGKEKGIAMFLEPGERFATTEIHASPEKRSLRFLLRYVMTYRRYFGLIFAGLILGSLLQLIFPFMTQAIVDIGINGRDIRFIWLMLLGELMIVFGRTAANYTRSWLMMHISMRVNISIVSDFFIKLLRLPMSFFDTKLLGDLMQRMGDHGRVQSFLTGQILGIVYTLFNFTVFGVVLVIYSRPVFLIFCAASVVYALWTLRFLRRRKILDYECFELNARNNNRTYQFLTSMQEIKLQDCGQRRRWEWEDVQADMFRLGMKSMKLQQVQESGSLFINEIRNAVITVVAATSVVNGEITFGTMLAIQYIAGQLSSPVSQIMGFIYSLQDVRISLERINEVHEAENEESPQGGLTAYAGPRREIELGDVHFRYNPHALSDTISGVSFSVPEGKLTAIVGASGCGKTTLIRLMLGYYPLRSGSLTVSGAPLQDYSLGWWRGRCGVVMQDGVIFSESVARNIAVADGPVDTRRLEMAARVACVHEFIETLPLRYNTIIGRDGLGLSQGQKQRILIARAVYKDPDFLFLDEATNSLDARNERRIVENLAEFFRGRTVVVVAHRLSTVRDADNIIVMEDGRVAEHGTHEELTERRGAYFTLVRNQLENNLVDD